MVFSSTIFLFLFLPCVLAAYFLAPRALRNAVLLCASLFFYAWGETFYVLVMILSIVANYVTGRMIGRAIERSGHVRSGRLALASGIAIDLLILCSFKYANFFTDNLNLVLGWLGAEPIELAPVHLPIGISFFTLQAVSYIVDVYRGEARVQKSLVDLALYISLFPQLIAGPIVRYQHVDDQLRQRRATWEGFALGVRRFVLGLGKKVLIANPLSVATQDVFGLGTDQLGSGVAWFGLVGFTLQVYFDFSGYSDMAIGLGRMLGFEFRENFDFPLISRSMKEIWARWHISLSTWFRDYLYVPLGGNRVGPVRLYRNLMTVFLLCGLWHGANWTYVAFGAYHGFFLVLERQPFLARLGRVPAAVQHMYAVTCWTLGVVLFRAVDIVHAGNYYKALFGLGSAEGSWHTVRMYLTPEITLVGVVAVLCSMPLHRAIGRRYARLSGGRSDGGWRVAAALGSFGSVVGLAAILFLCAVYLSATTHNPFIYFQF